MIRALIGELTHSYWADLKDEHTPMISNVTLKMQKYKEKWGKKAWVEISQDP